MTEIEKKEIEEMASVMCGNDCEECRRESIEFYGNSYDKDTQCLFNLWAEGLYNAGYRNVKDSVVLSREEYELLNDIKALHIQIIDSLKHINDEDIANITKQASKETAKKCRDFVKEWVGNSEEGLGFLFDFEDFIEKQFGAEIKE